MRHQETVIVVAHHGFSLSGGMCFNLALGRCDSLFDVFDDHWAFVIGVIGVIGVIFDDGGFRFRRRRR